MLKSDFETSAEVAALHQGMDSDGQAWQDTGHLAESDRRSDRTEFYGLLSLRGLFVSFLSILFSSQRSMFVEAFPPKNTFRSKGRPSDEAAQGETVAFVVKSGKGRLGMGITQVLNLVD